MNYTATQWGARKKELLAYLRANPEATMYDLRKNGYLSVLHKIFHNRINEAKMATKVPENHQRKRKRDEDDRQHLLSYLRKNPDVAITEMEEHPKKILWAVYRGRINQAKREASIGI